MAPNHWLCGITAPLRIWGLHKKSSPYFFTVFLKCHLQMARAHTHTHTHTHADTHTHSHRRRCTPLTGMCDCRVGLKCVCCIWISSRSNRAISFELYIYLQMSSSSMSYHWLKACQQVIDPLFRLYSHLLWYRMRPMSLTCLPTFVMVDGITWKPTYVRPMGSTLLFCMCALWWNVPWCISNVKLLIDTMSNVWMAVAY